MLSHAQVLFTELKYAPWRWHDHSQEVQTDAAGARYAAEEMIAETGSRRSDRRLTLTRKDW